VYFDENALNYVPARDIDGAYSCLDYYQSVNDPFSNKLMEEYSKRFPDTKYRFTAGSAATGMYRGIKFYEAAVKETKGDLHRDAVAAAMDHGVIADGPGGGSSMVPGHMHCKMNMYTAVCKVTDGKPAYEIVDKADMVDPREC